MKIVFKLLAILIGMAVLFMGVLSLFPQFSGFLSKSTAIIFIILGVYFLNYAMTGRSSFLGK